MCFCLLVILCSTSIPGIELNQGDTIGGTINRIDVAEVVVEAALSPATENTLFEVYGEYHCSRMINSGVVLNSNKDKNKSQMSLLSHRLMFAFLWTSSSSPKLVVSYHTPAYFVWGYSRLPFSSLSLVDRLQPPSLLRRTPTVL